MWFPVSARRHGSAQCVDRLPPASARSATVDVLIGLPGKAALVLAGEVRRECRSLSFTYECDYGIRSLREALSFIPHASGLAGMRGSTSFQSGLTGRVCARFRMSGRVTGRKSHTSTPTFTLFRLPFQY